MPAVATPCRRTAKILIAALFLAFLALGPTTAVADMSRLLEQADKLDQLDKLDIHQALEKAAACTRARDFPCAEDRLREARKRVTDPASRSALSQAEAGLRAEIQRVQEEERAFALRQQELQQQIALAEQRLKEAQRRALREEEELASEQARAQERVERQAQRAADEADERAATIALIGGMLSQQIRAQANTRSVEQARARQFAQMQSNVAASTARDQERFALERARLEQQRAELQQRQAQAKAELPQLSQQRASAAREQQAQESARSIEVAAQQARATEVARTKEAQQLMQATNQERPDALAFCWESNRGNWLCDGKTQDTTIAYETMDESLRLVGCDRPERVVNTMVTLTSTRVERWGQKTGWLFRCGKKLETGETGHATWNRDIRRFWSGIRW